MAISITAKNMDLTPAIRDYAEKKLGKLDRHLTNILETKIEVAEQKARYPEQRYVAQVTVNNDGTLLRGEERGQDVFSAIDKTAKVMERLVERYKGKANRKGRGSSTIKGKYEIEPSTPIPPERKIARVKHFAVTPMSPEEAIDQMELLGHSFFLFYNTESKKLNLLYKRKDEDYGMIDPDVEWTPTIPMGK